jgi:hypothetical protein
MVIVIGDFVAEVIGVVEDPARWSLSDSHPSNAQSTIACTYREKRDIASSVMIAMMISTDLKTEYTHTT